SLLGGAVPAVPGRGGERCRDERARGGRRRAPRAAATRSALYGGGARHAPRAPGVPAAARREPPPRDRLSTVAALVTRPGAVLMSRTTARALGLTVGARLAVRAGGGRAGPQW